MYSFLRTDIAPPEYTVLYRVLFDWVRLFSVSGSEDSVASED
jgi:hypothetical protein